MGEQQAVAEGGEPLDGGVERVVEALERALEQQPRRVARALGDQLQLAVVELQRVLVRELAALVQAHSQALGVDRALGCVAVIGEGVDVAAGEVDALDVRRAGNVMDAVCVQAAGVPQGLLDRGGPVVQAREEVGVQVHVAHSPYVVPAPSARFCALSPHQNMR